MTDTFAELDLLIRGGTVIDGTRAPRYDADVGLRDGRIVAALVGHSTLRVMTMASLDREATPAEIAAMQALVSEALAAGAIGLSTGTDAQGEIVAGDIEVQTRVVLERIAATLAELGASLADVVRVTVWLADLAEFPAFNTEYRRHFAAAELPARSTVEARLYKGGSRSKSRRWRRRRADKGGVFRRAGSAAGARRSLLLDAAARRSAASLAAAP